jgi:hypothetical protein
VSWLQDIHHLARLESLMLDLSDCSQLVDVDGLQNLKSLANVKSLDIRISTSSPLRRRYSSVKPAA